MPVWLYVPVTMFVLVGTVNAVNLTDGLDGLATGTTAVSAAAFGLLALFSGYPDLALFAGALTGACLGFFWFNAPPAQVFMGDTGSFGLGGAALAAMAILTKTPLFFAHNWRSVCHRNVIRNHSGSLFSGYGGGGRLFKMAPLHHHFEVKGFAESTVMIRFWLIALVFAILGLLAFL